MPPCTKRQTITKQSSAFYIQKLQTQKTNSRRTRQREKKKDLYIHLQTTSLADLGSETNLLAIPIGISRALDLLAESADSNVLPVADALHLGKELTSRAGGAHGALDVLVDGCTLLEETDGVVVAANAVVGVLQGLGDLLVGVHDQSRLGEVAIRLITFNVLCSRLGKESYLDHGCGNAGLAAVGADLVLLGLADDGAGVLGLKSIEAGKVVAGLNLALAFVVEVFDTKVSGVNFGDISSVFDGLGGKSVGGSGAEGEVGDDLRELHCVSKDKKNLKKGCI